MPSLAATIARRRIYYPRPVARLPDILMIAIPRRLAPRRFAGKHLRLGRFYPMLIETVEEQAEVEAFLAAQRATLVAPGLLDERPSSFAKEHLTIAHYAPPQSAWPFVQLCQWPSGFAARAPGSEPMFARGAYTFELFRGRVQLEQATRALLGSLDRPLSLRVETVFPDWSADPDASLH